MKSMNQKRFLLPTFFVVCILCLFFMGSKPDAGSDAQANSSGDILVVPVQIERDSYGLAMVDKTNQTMWVYELNSKGPAHSRLRLLAARSWRYDRLLEDLNTAEPRPQQVRILLESLREQSKNKDSKKEREVPEVNELDK